MLWEAGEHIENKTTTEVLVGRKAVNLASLVLHGSRSNDLPHMRIVEMVKQTKNISTNRQLSLGEEASSLFTSVGLYCGEKIGVPMSVPH